MDLLTRLAECPITDCRAELNICSGCALECFPKRFAPRLPERIHTALYHGDTLILDAEVTASDGARLLSLNVILCRNCADPSKQSWWERHHRARAAFPEEHGLDGLAVRIACQLNFG